MQFVNALLSTKTTLALLMLFAAAIAAATFIENDHGAATARQVVYEAWWFEVVMIWLGINFLAHIRHYRLFHPGRRPLGLFHAAFGIIILGAGVTRYFSTEGAMHIREGSAESVFYTTTTFLQAREKGENGRRFERQLQVHGWNFRPRAFKLGWGEPELSIAIESFIPAARRQFGAGSDTLFDIALTIGDRREDFVLPSGKELPLAGLCLAARRQAGCPIRLFKQDSIWIIESDVHLNAMDMASQQMSAIHAGNASPLQVRALYQWESGAFVVKAIHENARLEYAPEEDPKLAENLPDAVLLKISDATGATLAEDYFSIERFSPAWRTFVHQGREYAYTYGPKAVQLPFSLHLDDFEMERYPGSQSPSSYASEVVVMDGEGSFPYRIFMNNVLNHRGYRFYQSSYDTDEQGTVLAVNQDRPGTYLSYLGYFLLALGMFLTLFAPGSRFRLLNQRLGQLRRQGAVLAALLLAGSAPAAANPIGPEASIVPKEIAAEYGRLIVQDLDGRMKPASTLAGEIVRKLGGKSWLSISTGAGDIRLSPEQFLLAVQLDPQTYSALPLIKIHPEKSTQVFEALGLSPRGRLSFQDFLDSEGRYLLQGLAENAHQLKPAERSEEHKELLKTDERFNIFFALLSGDFLRLFPNKEDENNTWFTRQQYGQGFSEEDARFVRNITGLYLAGLEKGLREGNWQEAEEALSYIRLFQQKAGASVYPPEERIRAELLYNRLKLGSRLFGPFWLLGALLLVLAIAMLFRDGPLQRAFQAAGRALALLGFLAYSFHLGLRWYVAEHPPWSDGFEMLAFVAWGVLLFGLLFSGKSLFTIPLSLLFSGTLLFVSYLDWLNPEITNLMPVLHSYWLKIHVAIIVSGYAPLALAAAIALLSLLLLAFKPGQPQARWWVSMQELRIVSEMSVTIGLFLLAVGTFLGGVWANESWGRYWAWDPKEAWALVSIITYAFVLHLRLAPAFNNALAYNLASLWAFSSIIMTSFGVNYYLSGLHSYAKGDPLPIPGWVYWAILILAAISAAAAMRYRRLSPAERRALQV